MELAIQFFTQTMWDLWTFIFDRCQVVDGVYIGWVFITILVFNVLLRSLLALPRSAPRMRNKSK